MLWASKICPSTIKLIKMIPQLGQLEDRRGWKEVSALGDFK